MGATAAQSDPASRAAPTNGGALADFRHFFDAHFAYVRRTLQRLGVHDEDVDDVAQEVFMAMHRRFHEYDPDRSGRAWASAFSCRIAANYRRLARHRHEVEDVQDEHPSTAADPEARAVQAQKRALVLAALQALPIERRTVLVLYDLDGLEAAEIAEVLEIPRNTVYSRLRVARKEMQSAVRRLSGGAP